MPYVRSRDSVCTRFDCCAALKGQKIVLRTLVRLIDILLLAVVLRRCLTDKTGNSAIANRPRCRLRLVLYGTLR